MSMSGLSVCLSARISQNHASKLHQSFCARCLWLRLGSPLATLCTSTSSFVDDVAFSYNGPYGGLRLLQQSHSNVVHGLTPVACCVVMLASCPIDGLD